MFISIANRNAEKQLQAASSSERPIRSLAKAISWRITGSIDTMLLSWFFTGSMAVAAAISLTEVVTKMVLYYLHERVWNRITLGRCSNTERKRRNSYAHSAEASQPAYIHPEKQVI